MLEGKFSIVLIFIFMLNFSLAQQHTNETNREKDERAFSIFSVVNFKNTPCRTGTTFGSGGGFFRNGTCYTSDECSSKGGTASGNCASGFGVCCLFIVQTSSSLSPIVQNNTYVQNPGFPAVYGATTGLTYNINKCNTNVCWLRLDFETFNILGPSTSSESLGGQCASDSLKITVNTGPIIPLICGLNTGQHIYVDIGNLPADTVSLVFGFLNPATIRNWDIRVAQIECSNPSSPPDGCLQYWTTETGRITTFNFDAANSNHLANQDYSVCIRQQQGFCCIQYSACAGVPNSFSLDQSPVAAAIGNVDTTCATLDYVAIPGSNSVCSSTNNALNTLYCGNIINPDVLGLTSIPICDCTRPFLVHFFTNNIATNTEATLVAPRANRGVCLDYMQIPCQTS